MCNNVIVLSKPTWRDIPPFVYRKCFSRRNIGHSLLVRRCALTVYNESKEGRFLDFYLYPLSTLAPFPPAPSKGFRVKELEQARDKLSKRVEEASAREKGADARLSALEEQVVDLKAKIEQAR